MTYYQKRGIHKRHCLFEKYNVRFENLPDTHHKITGVYMIGDFYIGASKHIRERVLVHLRGLDRGYHENRQLKESFHEFIETYGGIRISLLNLEPKSEAYFIDKYKKRGFPLVNNFSAQSYHQRYK